MNITLQPLHPQNLAAAAGVWNQIVEEGNSFPGDTLLTIEQAEAMFSQQTETVCAFDGEKLIGLYILHPNNIGRCAHIANASYAIEKEYRGRGIGRLLVCDCIERAKKSGFKGLQFNAVVATNYRAINLYLKLGFTIIGTIQGGYRLKDNTFADTLILLKSW